MSIQVYISSYNYVLFKTFHEVINFSANPAGRCSVSRDLGLGRKRPLSRVEALPRREQVPRAWNPWSPATRIGIRIKIPGYAVGDAKLQVIDGSTKVLAPLM